VVLPLVVMLLFGFVQFGLATGDRIQADSAAREAARLAVVGIDDRTSIGGSGKGFWQRSGRSRCRSRSCSRYSFVFFRHCSS
jgi:Flp pilus assembly protein TadG